MIIIHIGEIPTGSFPVGAINTGGLKRFCDFRPKVAISRKRYKIAASFTCSFSHCDVNESQDITFAGVRLLRFCLPVEPLSSPICCSSCPLVANITASIAAAWPHQLMLWMCSQQPVTATTLWLLQIS